MSELEVYVLRFPGGRREHEFYKRDDVDAMLAALPPAMTWTTTAPTKPGFYWWRVKGRHDLRVLCVTINPDGTYWVPDAAALNLPGEWAGPLEPPQ